MNPENQKTQPEQTLLAALAKLETDVAPMTDTQATALYRRALQKAALQTDGQELPRASAEKSQTPALQADAGKTARALQTDAGKTAPALQTGAGKTAQDKTDAAPAVKKTARHLARWWLRAAALLAVCGGALALAGVLHGGLTTSKSTDAAAPENGMALQSADEATEPGMARSADTAGGEERETSLYSMDPSREECAELAPDQAPPAASPQKSGYDGIAMEAGAPAGGGLDLRSIPLYAPAGASQVRVLQTAGGDPTLFFQLGDVEYRLTLLPATAVTAGAQDGDTVNNGIAPRQDAWQQEVLDADGDSYQMYYFYPITDGENDSDSDAGAVRCVDWSEEGVWYRLTSQTATEEDFASAAAEVLYVNAGEVRAVLKASEEEAWTDPEADSQEYTTSVAPRG